MLEVASRHRISIGVPPTGKPGDRVDVHAGASTLKKSLSEQRVKYCSCGTEALMYASMLSWGTQERSNTAGLSLFQVGLPAHQRCLWPLLLPCLRCWHAPIAANHPWRDTSVSGGLTLPQAATAGSGRP